MANGGHLILTRRTNEIIVIQDPTGKELAQIQIVEANFGRARIGIRAHPSIRIIRQELLQDDLPRSTLVPK